MAVYKLHVSQGYSNQFGMRRDVRLYESYNISLSCIEINDAPLKCVQNVSTCIQLATVVMISIVKQTIDGAVTYLLWRSIGSRHGFKGIIIKTVRTNPKILFGDRCRKFPYSYVNA